MIMLFDWFIIYYQGVNVFFRADELVNVTRLALIEAGLWLYIKAQWIIR